MGSMTVFTVVALLIFAAIAYVLVKLVRSLFGRKQGRLMVCTRCGTQGPSVDRTPGHFLLEVVLWLCFLIPGLIYSVWRVSSRKMVCGACGAESIVPADTPAAQRILRSARE